MTDKTRTRLTADERKSHILQKALSLSEEVGYNNFSCPQLAEACGCGHPLILYHFTNMEYLREEIMRKAIVEKNLQVIAQGLVNKDLIAGTAPDNLKRKALSLKNI